MEIFFFWLGALHTPSGRFERLFARWNSKAHCYRYAVVFAEGSSIGAFKPIRFDSLMGYPHISCSVLRVAICLEWENMAGFGLGASGCSVRTFMSGSGALPLTKSFSCCMIFTRRWALGIKSLLQHLLEFLPGVPASIIRPYGVI